jgi:hypothetical protein
MRTKVPKLFKKSLLGSLLPIFEKINILGTKVHKEGLVIVLTHDPHPNRYRQKRTECLQGRKVCDSWAVSTHTYGQDVARVGCRQCGEAQKRTDFDCLKTKIATD